MGGSAGRGVGRVAQDDPRPVGRARAARRGATAARQGHGATGSNLDYVKNTVRHLRELGLRDRALEELARRAGA